MIPRPFSREDLQRLYQAIGSEERLMEILDRFYRRMADDLLIGFFFTGKDLTLIARRQGEFLLRAMGARPSYSGKAPAMAHLEIPPILPGHFDRRLRILEETLQASGLDPESIQLWISFENAFRDSVQAYSANS